MRIEATGQWGPCADVRRSPRQGAALAVAAKAHYMMEVHRVLEHPSEEITKKTVQAMRIATTGHWGPCEERLQVKAKRQVVQWIDRSGKTGSNSVGDEDLDVKPGEGELVGKREASQLDVQELELEQQPASQESKQETWEAPSDREKETWEAPSDLKEETQEAPLDPEETQKALPDPDEETREAPLEPGRRYGKSHRIARKRHKRRHLILTRRYGRRHRIPKKRNRRRRRIPRRRQMM